MAPVSTFGVTDRSVSTGNDAPSPGPGNPRGWRIGPRNALASASASWSGPLRGLQAALTIPLPASDHALVLSFSSVERPDDAAGAVPGGQRPSRARRAPPLWAPGNHLFSLHRVSNRGRTTLLLA